MSDEVTREGEKVPEALCEAGGNYGLCKTHPTCKLVLDERDRLREERDAWRKEAGGHEPPSEAAGCVPCPNCAGFKLPAKPCNFCGCVTWTGEALRGVRARNEKLLEAAREAYVFIQIASRTHGADSPILRGKLSDAIAAAEEKP